MRLAHGHARIRTRAGRLRGAIAFCIVVFGLLGISLLWTIDPSTAVVKSYELVLLFLATVAFAILIATGRSVQPFWMCVTVLGSLLSALAMITAIAAPGRLAVLGGGPNTLGRLMGLSVVIAMAQLTAGGSLLAWLPVAVAGSTVLVLTGSRGAFLATAIASIVILALSKVANRRRVLTLTSLGICITAFILLMPFGHAVVSMFQERIVRLLIEQHYAAGRVNLYAAAVDLWRTHPILGAGQGAFATQGLGDYPHNFFLEIAAEIGTVGFLLCMVWIAAVALRVLAVRRRVDVKIIAACVLFLVAAQLSGDVFDNRAFFMFLAWLQLQPLSDSLVPLASLVAEPPWAPLSIRAQPGPNA